MPRFVPPCLRASMCGCGLAACSPQESSAAGPTDDPCALVSKSQVREAFPGAESGKRDHSTDQYGIASCKWELPTSTLAAQTFKSTNSASDELRGRMAGLPGSAAAGGCARKFSTTPWQASAMRRQWSR